MNVKIVPLIVLFALVAGVCAGQAAPTATAAPVAPNPNDLSVLLRQLDQTANTANMDLGKLRIEKWKADGSAKQQFQSNAELLSRNMTGTLPALVTAARTSPQNLAANFKLYRNVDALYDVLSSLADSAGHYAPANDYQTLAADSSNLQQIRHALADRVEQLATWDDAQLVRMTSGGGATAKTNTAPKKIVIDDTAPAKSTHKKKTPRTTTTSTSNPQ
jgi:hypothetical protein